MRILDNFYRNKIFNILSSIIFNSMASITRDEVRTSLEKSLDEFKKEVKNKTKKSDSDYITVSVDYNDLMDAGPATIEWINENTYEAFDVIKKIVESTVGEISLSGKLPSFGVDIKNVPRHNGKIGEVFLSDIKAKHIHTFISTEGVANHVSQSVPLLARKAFNCADCGKMFYAERDNRFESFSKLPNSCPGGEGEEECNGELVRSYEKDEFIDERRFELKEKPGRAQKKGGSGMEITVVATHDNTTKPHALRHLKVRGFLKIVPKDEEREIYDYYIKATGIDVKGERYEEINLTEEDVEQCKSIAEKDDNVIINMAESLCPYFYGQKYLKTALFLQQVRGQKTELRGSSIGDHIHIIWLGDPGTRKSLTAKQIADVSPAGVFTSCENATKAATTAFVEKDSSTDEWRLVAGALPRAHRGFAALDELDKANKDIFQGIREAMEDGEITVRRGGIHETLPADVCVLITLNPKGGRLEPGRPGKQLPKKFEASLMNRMDLAFVSRDEPDTQEDHRKARHLLDTMRGKTEESSYVDEPKYDKETLKKYIAWARQRRVEITDSAAEYLTGYYVKMRKKAEGAEGMPVPIGLRQVSSITKVSTAIAKATGADYVTKEHTEKATDLLEEALKQWDVEMDTGVADIDLFEGRTGQSMRTKMNKVEQYLEQKENESEEEEVLKEELGKSGMNSPGEVIDKLYEDNRILRPKPGIVKLA